MKVSTIFTALLVLNSFCLCHSWNPIQFFSDQLLGLFFYLLGVFTGVDFNAGLQQTEFCRGDTGAVENLECTCELSAHLFWGIFPVGVRLDIPCQTEANTLACFPLGSLTPDDTLFCGTHTFKTSFALTFFFFIDPESSTPTVKPITLDFDLQSPNDYPVGDAPTLVFELALDVSGPEDVVYKSCDVKLDGRDCSCATMGSKYNFDCSGVSIPYDGMVVDTLGTNPDTDFPVPLEYVTVSD